MPSFANESDRDSLRLLIKMLYKHKLIDLQTMSMLVDLSQRKDLTVMQWTQLVDAGTNLWHSVGVAPVRVNYSSV